MRRKSTSSAASSGPRGAFETRSLRYASAQPGQVDRNGRRRRGRRSHSFEPRDRGLRVLPVSRVVPALELGRLKDLEKENARLRRAVSDLTLDKLILKEVTEENF